MIYVVAFLLLCTALCCPIFMQLFGGDFGFIGQDETELRCDTFWESYLTLIMVIVSAFFSFFFRAELQVLTNRSPSFFVFFCLIQLYTSETWTVCSQSLICSISPVSNSTNLAFF